MPEVKTSGAAAGVRKRLQTGLQVSPALQFDLVKVLVTITSKENQEVAERKAKLIRGKKGKEVGVAAAVYVQ